MKKGVKTNVMEKSIYKVKIYINLRITDAKILIKMNFDFSFEINDI